jgi:hypothetical protein
MAANTNKRVSVKWVRDKAKAAYDKKSECFICGNTEELELHHLHGMTNLLERWAKQEGISLNTDEDIISVRDRFIEEHHKEIYVDVYTLCAKHHKHLHTVYSKSPALSTAYKQENWILKMKDRINGIHPEISKPNELVRKSESSSTNYSPSGRSFGSLINGHVNFSSLRQD